MDTITIQIAIASSTVEFCDERTDLANFIRFVSEKLEGSGVRLKPKLCEEMRASVGPEHDQDCIDRMIRDSDFCVVLFGHEAGEYTVHEYQVALDAFNVSRKNPLLIVKLKACPPGKEDSASIQKFIEEHDKNGHYSNRFEHIDTIKNVLMLELCDAGVLRGSKLTFEDGSACLDGVPMLPLDNIAAWSRNEGLQSMRAELAKLDEQIAGLSAVPNRDPAIDGILQEKKDARTALYKKMSEAEGSVLSMLQEINRAFRTSGASQRYLDAAALLDEGKYDEVYALLRDKARKTGLEIVQQVSEITRQKASQYIAENRLLIKALRSEGITEKSEQEIREQIRELYEESCKLAEDYRTDLDVLYDYSWFLFFLPDFARGSEVAERLHKLYDLYGTEEIALADCLETQGMLYSFSRKYEEAEKYQRAALKIVRRLAADDYDKYGTRLAGWCENLAHQFDVTKKYEDAEVLLRESVEITDQFAAKDLLTYGVGFANRCCNYAYLLCRMDKKDEAKHFYRTALETMYKLISCDFNRFAHHLAVMLNTLVNSFIMSEQHKQAEAVCCEQQSIYHKVDKDEPDADRSLFLFERLSELVESLK